MHSHDIDVLAVLLKSIEPYLSDIVLVGGWAHALHLREACPSSRAVHTTDVDITIPRRLPSYGRPELLRLVEDAGFEIEAVGKAGLVLIRKNEVDLDILCDAESASDIIRVEGQGELCVQGYPFLDMHLAASRSVTVGTDLHPAFEPPIDLQIPTLPAYVLGKILSASGRSISRRRTKDLVYLYQVTLERPLMDALLADLSDHVRAFPTASRSAVEALTGFLEQTTVLRDVARQIRELGLLSEPDSVADFTARMDRLRTEIVRRL